MPSIADAKRLPQIDIWSNLGLADEVARALAESEHLTIDPNQLEYYPGHSSTTGGNATVKEAELGCEIVAVKELRIGPQPVDRARFAKRFARELKVWAILDHPNLLKLSGFHLSQDLSLALFISPFLRNGNVGNYLLDNSPPFEVRCRLAEETALGLTYLHEKGIVHGDLKHPNVLVDDEVRAVLCDYGLARIINPDGVSSGLTSTGIKMTTRYASPELLNGNKQDLESDVWAWGCLFMTVITGIIPYRDTREMALVVKIISGTLPTDVSTLKVLPKSFRAILLQCWEVNPLARCNIGKCARVLQAERLSLTASDSSTSVSELQENTRTQRINLPFLRVSPSNPTTSGRNTSKYAALPASAPNLTCLSRTTHNLAIPNRATHEPTSAKIATSDLVTSHIASPRSSDPKSLAANPGIGDLDCQSQVHHIPTTPDPTAHNTIPPGSDVPKLITPQPSLHNLEPVTHEPVTQPILASPTLPNPKPPTPDPETGVSASKNQTSLTPLASTEVSKPSVKTLEGNPGRVSSIAISPDGRLLASGSYEKELHLWDMATGNLQETLSGHTGAVRSVAFSPNGERLASGSADGTARIWDVRSGVLISTLVAHTGCVHSISFSRIGRRLVSGSADATVRVWDLVSGQVKTLLRESSDVRAVVCSPNGTQMAHAGGHVVQIWEIPSLKLVAKLQGHTNVISSLAFSPDSTCLATGSHDTTMIIWDIKKQRIAMQLKGHTNRVNSVDYSSDGVLLVSGSDDRTVRIWDVTSGAMISILEGHGSDVKCVRFLLDCRKVVSGSCDKTVRVWNPKIGK